MKVDVTSPPDMDGFTICITVTNNELARWEYESPETKVFASWLRNLAREAWKDPGDDSY